MHPPIDLAKLSHYEYRFLVEEAPRWDNKVIDMGELQGRIPLGNPAHWVMPKLPTASNGYFDRLSTELVHMTLCETVLCAMMNLRATNSHFRTIIEQWGPFRNVFLHGPRVFRAVIATKAMWTAPQVVPVIFTQRCEFCGDYGTFLQLLKLQRCCFKCLTNDQRLAAVRPKYAVTTMGVSERDISRIPKLTTIARQNFWGSNAGFDSMVVLDYTKALELSRLNKRTPAIPTILRKRLCQEQRAAAKGARSADNDVVLNPITQKPIRPNALTVKHTRTLHKLNLSAETTPPDCDMLRFFTAIHAPIVNPATINTIPSSASSPILQAGGYCKGCRYYWNLHSSHNPLEHRYYTIPELQQHLATCYFALCYYNKLYPANEIRQILLRDPQKKAIFPRDNSFELIPDRLIQFQTLPSWLNHLPRTSLTYGVGFLQPGSDADSQGAWATASAGRKCILDRYVNVLLEKREKLAHKKEEMGIDMRAWRKAAKWQHGKPRMNSMGVRCEKGLPMSDKVHEDHTVWFPHYITGDIITIWLDYGHREHYAVPRFLDYFSL